MSGELPKLEKLDSGFRVALFARDDRGPIRMAKISMVVDVDERGNPVAIEVLSLLDQCQFPLFTPPRTPEFRWNAKFNYAYDESADAFWLNIGSGGSVDQISVEGQVLADASGCLLGIEANYPIPAGEIISP